MPDINLNGSGDGVRMTWPRAAFIASVLLVCGGTWAGVGFQLAAMQDSEKETRAEVQELRADFKDLRDAYLMSVAPPPKVDAKGRILK